MGWHLFGWDGIQQAVVPLNKRCFLFIQWKTDGFVQIHILSVWKDSQWTFAVIPNSFRQLHLILKYFLYAVNISSIPAAVRLPPISLFSHHCQLQ